tara:strand:- start:140 stop:358 length:219 start_codon:yes stop_codon:yes gene_type:complete
MFEPTIFQSLIFIYVILIISIWEAIWKGFGLWHSARNKQLGWFIAILVLNTVGIVPIVYLVWFRKDKKRKRK